MLPPRLIRRLVLAPLVIILAVGFLVLSPFLALLALVFGLAARPRTGHMRSLRLVGFVLVWFVAETVALVMLAGLWVVSGFGGRLRTEPYQSRHYAVMRWFLDLMYRGAERTYGLRAEIDEPEFTTAEAAARLARGLDANGALVIFPEGGNWTPHRWRRGIRRLEHQGRLDLAARARDMPNLLPPRPGGTLAAISACPDADVIFVAHAGLDNIITLGDVWGKFPINQVIRAKWWRVPYDQVPREAGHEAQVQWLYDWWERIDTWISQNRPSRDTVLEVAPIPEDEAAEPVGELPASRVRRDWPLIAGDRYQSACRHGTSAVPPCPCILPGIKASKIPSAVMLPNLTY